MSASGGSVADPVLRNALRYTISTREYAALHKYVLARSRLLRQKAPSVGTVESLVDGPTAASLHRRPRSTESSSVDTADQHPAHQKTNVERRPPENKAENTRPIPLGESYNVRAIRHSVRVFMATGLAMRLYEALLARLAKTHVDSGVSKPHKQSQTKSAKVPFYKSTTLRLSLSLSTILLLYRILFRFFTRLRGHLLASASLPFRQRNPRTSATLTSPYAPAVGASLAGVMLGVLPSRQLRVSISIYAVFRALEFAWNLYEGRGSLWGFHPGTNIPRDRPWWFGSWMLQPLAFGQLLHAAVFDPESYPGGGVGKAVLSYMGSFLEPRPEGLPAHTVWPGIRDVLDGMATMAKLHWPEYISPTLFPNRETLPAQLASLGPLTSRAHPLIRSLSCATIHPRDPSCARSYLTFWLQSFSPLARIMILFYSTTTFIPQFHQLYHAPLTTLRTVFLRALRMSTFLTGMFSTAWASLCFFQTWFPRRFLPTQRVFLGGFLAGLWAFWERRSGRSLFLSTARMSLDSFWKVGIKRRWWKAMRGGDVWLFVAALAVSSVVYEKDARAMKETHWRKGMSWVRGEGWRDWSMAGEGDEDDDDEKRE